MKKRYIFDKSVGDESFVMSDGATIHSIKELYLYLDNISDQTFSDHVNSEKNDFNVWIKDVFKREDLTELMQDCRTKEGLKKVLRDWISDIIHAKHASEKNKAPQNAEQSVVIKKVKFKSKRKRGPRRVDRKKTIENNNELTETLVCKPEITKKDDLLVVHRPKRMLTLMLDFITGFIIGATTILLVNVFY